MKTYYNNNKIQNAEKNFDIAKNQYLNAVEILFIAASASEDLTKAFEQNINEAQKLIEEAFNLDHTHARVWLNNYRLINDFGA
ncbi:23748_t:CDS:2, partial [Dentiscutata erythropus]